jgi:hypothetical protein
LAVCFWSWRNRARLRERSELLRPETEAADISLWLVPLGYLASRSRMFSKALGVVLIVGGVCYLVDTLAPFLVPDVGARIQGFLAIPPAIAEIWMVGYLLVKGVNV